MVFRFPQSADSRFPPRTPLYAPPEPHSARTVWGNLDLTNGIQQKTNHPTDFNLCLLFGQDANHAYYKRHYIKKGT